MFYVLILNIENQKFSLLVLMSYIFTLPHPTTSDPSAGSSLWSFRRTIEMVFAQPDNPYSFIWN